MKIFFLENDSFYKIFKTLEKLPHHKKVICFVDVRNPMFDNNRRGSQIYQLLERKDIQATRIAKNEKSKRFYQQSWLTYEYKYHNHITKMLHTAHLFFFEKKKFNQTHLNNNTLLKNIIKTIEISTYIGILYLIYTIILPSSTITITPNYNLQDVIYNFRYYPHTTDLFQTVPDRLSIPYHKWSLQHTITLKKNVKNIANAQKKARGTITLTNTTNIPYNIVAGTTFITESGLLFECPYKFTIPAKKNESTPSTITLDLIAKNADIENNIMWSKWNIEKDTKLYIKNLKSSYFFKQIYAHADGNFMGGETLSNGSIMQEDIDTLKEDLVMQAQRRAKEIIRQYVSIPNTIILYVDDAINLQSYSFSTPYTTGQNTSTIEWSLIVTYAFPYVQKTDILDQFKHYVTERASGTEKVVDISLESLTLYNPKNNQTESNNPKDIEFIIPTEITTIQTYNFDNDPKNILPEIKNYITGKERKKALTTIQSYNEITTADINIKPGRLKQITTTKSRINFKIK